MCITNAAMLRCLRASRNMFHRYGGKHFTLLVTFVGYVLIGATIFYVLECESEFEERYKWREELQANRTEFIKEYLMDELFNNTQYFLWLTDRKTDQIIQVLDTQLQAYEERLGLKKLTKRQFEWNFINAIVYALQVITTIGHGNIKPYTDAGRIATIVYIVFGLPLMILLIHDLTYPFIVILTYPGKLLNCCWNCLRFCCNRNLDDFDSLKVEDDSVRERFLSAEPCGEIIAIRSEDSDSPKWAPSKRLILANRLLPPQPPRKTSPSILDVPILLAILVLVGWLTAGAFLFCYIEGHSNLLAGFYFCFTCLSTVGIGDVVPSNSKLFLAMFVYIILGLALVSMLMNLLQAKLRQAYAIPALQNASGSSQRTSMLVDDLSPTTHYVINHCQPRTASSFRQRESPRRRDPRETKSPTKKGGRQRDKASNQDALFARSFSEVPLRTHQSSGTNSCITLGAFQLRGGQTTANANSDMFAKAESSTSSLSERRNTFLAQSQAKPSEDMTPPYLKYYSPTDEHPAGLVEISRSREPSGRAATIVKLVSREVQTVHSQPQAPPQVLLHRKAFIYAPIETSPDTPITTAETNQYFAAARSSNHVKESAAKTVGTNTMTANPKLETSSIMPLILQEQLKAVSLANQGSLNTVSSKDYRDVEIEWKGDGRKPEPRLLKPRSDTLHSLDDVTRLVSQDVVFTLEEDT